MNGFVWGGFLFPLKVNRGGLVHRFLREGWEKYQRWRNVAMSVSSAWYYEPQFVIINNLKPSKSFQNGVPCNCPSFRFVNISILLHSSLYIFIYVRSVCVCVCVCVCVRVCVCSVAQSCPTLCNFMDCSPPGSSVHGISQPKILE